MFQLLRLTKPIHKGRCTCIKDSRGHKKGDERNYTITDRGDFLVSIRDVKDSGADGYSMEEFQLFYHDEDLIIENDKDKRRLPSKAA